MGLDALGLDLSKELLSEAQLHPEISGHLIRGDMRAIPLADESLDFIFSFFSSFGYFYDDDENKGVLREVYRVLKQGGGLLGTLPSPCP